MSDASHRKIAGRATPPEAAALTDGNEETNFTRGVLFTEGASDIARSLMSLVDVEGDAEGEDEKEKEDDADKDKAEGHKYSHKRQGPSNKASIGPLYGVRVIDLADKSYCWASIGGQGKICLKQNCPTKSHKDKPATLYPKLKAQGLHEVVLVESTVDRAFADFIWTLKSCTPAK